jgi:hypothetical protein
MTESSATDAGAHDVWRSKQPAKGRRRGQRVPPARDLHYNRLCKVRNRADPARKRGLLSLGVIV